MLKLRNVTDKGGCDGVGEPGAKYMKKGIRGSVENVDWSISIPFLVIS